jgi:GNAT superfamily N-acetyltransferase
MTEAPSMESTGVTLRRGTHDDTPACHAILWEAATDLGIRQGTPLEGTADDWWVGMESLHGHLAADAAEWWVAEEPGSRQILGYARSIERSGLLELTEFFVRPGRQSQGLGRALIERAFPVGRGEVRVIIATSEVRALARYYAADTVPRFPIFTLKREPVGDALESRLTASAPGDEGGLAEAVGEIERAVLGYVRGPAELAWLSGQREGYVYRNGDNVVGYAFVGPAGAGPIAALDPVLLPDMLLHVERRAHEIGLESLELEVPAPNGVAVRHLLGRGFRIDPWINFLLSNRPFGEFDRFIGISPPVFL